MKYKVALHYTEEGVSVCVPALPGCWSEGNTDEEALANIEDAIRFTRACKHAPYGSVRDSAQGPPGPAA